MLLTHTELIYDLSKTEQATNGHETVRSKVSFYQTWVSQLLFVERETPKNVYRYFQKLIKIFARFQLTLIGFFSGAEFKVVFF